MYAHAGNTLSANKPASDIQLLFLEPRKFIHSEPSRKCIQGKCAQLCAVCSWPCHGCLQPPKGSFHSGRRVWWRSVKEQWWHFYATLQQERNSGRSSHWPCTWPPEVNKTVISKDLPGGVRQQSLTITATAAYNHTSIVCIVSNGGTRRLQQQHP